ncbi:hypothetical protein KP509_15G023700 [Ceratopteris richardii]|uniref:Uncharacterized protein n=1 Tax=Ceratopteris richardii TaxID=49495 RepID=A0A8T2T5H3_CERRI|nr:hypothetical protein KP509_15G023700 [Ceratopteris richardii]
MNARRERELERERVRERVREREREGEKRYTVFTYILCAPTLARTVVYTYFPAKTSITLLCIHNCRNAHHVWMTCIFFELFRKCLGVSPVMLA